MEEVFDKIVLNKVPEKLRDKLLMIQKETENFKDLDMVNMLQENFNSILETLKNSHPESMGIEKEKTISEQIKEMTDEETEQLMGSKSKVVSKKRNLL